ncbi:hypothetical protein [Clostridium sp. D53t1_180928_C8]|uniref:hypothetical protein n=1 Tax=Clostridium sp. D53t1_180928_C8 TaxID=2787101 RepID=UPI0018A9F26B|nr:hypothetical protein [Clostridium sp. D53t1_180928_C8]
MEREKSKLNEKITSGRELLKIIEEKEIEIENQKAKLKLANDEIEKIKLDLNELRKNISNSIKSEDNCKVETKIDSDSENKVNLKKEESSISIEIVEAEDDEFVNKAISKLIAEVTNYEDNKDENLNQELAIDIVESEKIIEDDITLIENLKSAFIENNNYKVLDILNSILDNKNYVEVNFTNEEKIILLYLGYFYNKLEGLLNKYESIEEYYNSEDSEVALLKRLIKEKEYPIYKGIKETIANKMKSDNKLFKGLDTIIRVRIIDKIINIAYMTFEEVYSVKDLKYGQENITIMAWVKEKENMEYRLVEGLYCNTTEKLYMLESSIYVLGLNIKKVTDEEINNLKHENKICYKNEHTNFNIREEEKRVFSDYKETPEKGNDYIDEDDDIDEDDLSIWTRVKEKFTLRLKKR